MQLPNITHELFVRDKTKLFQDVYLKFNYAAFNEGQKTCKDETGYAVNGIRHFVNHLNKPQRTDLVQPPQLLLAINISNTWWYIYAVENLVIIVFAYGLLPFHWEGI